MNNGSTNQWSTLIALFQQSLHSGDPHGRTIVIDRSLAVMTISALEKANKMEAELEERISNAEDDAYRLATSDGL